MAKQNQKISKHAKEYQNTKKMSRKTKHGKQINNNLKNNCQT